MRMLILSFIVTIFCGGIGIAGDGFNITGNKWNSWNQNSKTYFIIGWAKCGLSASNNMPIFLGKHAEINEYVEIIYNSYKDEGVILEKVTSSQVIETLDKLYSDPRIINIDIQYIMPLVVGRLNSGWTMEQLDTVVSYVSRIDMCEKKEKQLKIIIDECSELRKERNAYMSKLKKK